MANHGATEVHPLAGKTVTIEFAGDGHPQYGKGPHEFTVEGWWDVLTGGPWGDAAGNPAAMIYGLRAGFAQLPWDDEVLYGKINGLGVLLHVSELPAEVR